MNISIRPEQPKTVYLNMKKIMKHVNSKVGLEAAKRYEENVRLMDFWHPNDTLEVRKAADELLKGFIDRMFDGVLSNYEKVAVIEQIQYKILTKINEAIKTLDNIAFYNVGKAGDEVLKCAIERDRHLDTVEGVLNEVKSRGQQKLNAEQTRVVTQEMKEADAFDERRKGYAKALEEGNQKNYEIAAEKGPKVLAAYVYLHGKTPTPKKK